MCQEDVRVLEQAYPLLLKNLQFWGLQIAAEKVQFADTGQFLGSIVLPDKILPPKLKIYKDDLYTLNDFQRLLGHINWLRPFLKIPPANLKPLLDILDGDPHITSPPSIDTGC